MNRSVQQARAAVLRAPAASLPPTPRELWSWAALALAFSPLLLDSARGVRDRPWASYGLLFVALGIGFAARDRSRLAVRRDGYLLLLAALALQGLAAWAGLLRWVRIALPLGMLGLARGLGWPSPRVAALSLWAVPLPSVFVTVASPWLESTWLEVGALVLSPFAAVSVHGTSAATVGGILSLRAADGGIPLGALLSGLGWVRALQDRRSLARALRTAAAWGLWALPLQALGVLAALALTAAGSPELARGWLAWGVLSAAAVTGLFLALRTRSSADG